MFPCTLFTFGFWWIFPLIMLILMASCFLMMRSRKGGMMCGPGSCCKGGHASEEDRKKP